MIALRASRKGRLLLFVVATAAVAAGGGIALTAVGTSPNPIDVTVTEGTNLAATVSPDHNTIIMDLQNRLWSMPIDGGDAKPLTDWLLEPSRPDWSPRGDLVTFESYKGGTFHIWVMNPDGSGVRQLTTGHGDDRDPRFSPDGTKIAFSSDRAFAGSYDVWVVDVASGSLTQITNGAADEFEPTWSPDGSRIAFVSGTGSTGTTIQSITSAGSPSSATNTEITAPAGSRLNSPSWSPDGKRIAYLQFAANKSWLMVSGTRVGASNDVFPFYPVWLNNDVLLYTADGRIHTTSVSSGTTWDDNFRATFTFNRPPYQRKAFDFDKNNPRQVLGIVGPALSPDGKSVAFEAINQIWVMQIGRKPQAITSDTYYKTDPAWSPDGTKLAYASDKNGTMHIFVRTLATGDEQQVTTMAGAQISPAWSPDGRSLAFQDQTGATFTIDVEGGAAKQVVPSLFAPGKPSWAANGKTIALAALKPYTHRFREGTSQVLTVDLTSGKITYTEPAPFESIGTRGEDGPVYAPDGSAMAYVMRSVLFIRPVDANGVPTGTAQQITTDVTDAPTWSGDSKKLLYLSNGKLRLVNRDGSGAQDVTADLSWQPEQQRGRTVIHAGQLWDGRGPDVQKDVDIVVVNNRIQSISPHSPNSGNGTGNGDQVNFVDASKLTVIPGLWESHTHEWIEGKSYGDRLGRLWMAYGVTTLNSVGDPAYRAAETREAFSSGQRIGPRYFATGEAIDGERVYYNFMRPVTGGDEQLQREISRAKALDYDMVKTYVRLPHETQAKVIQLAHDQLGDYVASHYMLPGVSYGEDGVTHVSATTRTGFAYTRSSAGVTYRDVIDTYVKSGAFDMSTTFNSSLYREDPQMVDDPRLGILNVPWDQASLRAKRDAAVNNDQTVSLDSLQKEEATVKAIRDGGGDLLAGTDSPLDNVATALHLNLRAQVKYGLEPWRALQSATMLTAKRVGVLKDLGTVEAGKVADLAFINGDPLTDIKQLANVQMVMKNGRIYTVADLEAPFKQAAGATSSALRAVRPNASVAGPADPRSTNGVYWWHDPAQMIEDDHQPPQ